MPHRVVTITLTQEQGEKVSKICTEINKAKEYFKDKKQKKVKKGEVREALQQDKISKAIYTPPMNPPYTTQPVTINNMLGLVCKQQKGRNYVTLIISNISAAAIELPQNLNIEPRQPPHFHKIINKLSKNKPEQVVMQIGPRIQDNIILTINEAGIVRRIFKEKLTKIEDSAISQAARHYKNHQEAEENI